MTGQCALVPAPATIAWGGFVLHGDCASVDEVRRLIYADHRCAALERELIYLQRVLSRLKEASHE